MVEEMYKEEFGASEISCNLSSENTPKSPRDNFQVSDNKREESQDNSVTDDSFQQRQLHGLMSDHSSTAELDRGIQCSDYAENFMGSTKLLADQMFSMNNCFDSSNYNGNGYLMGSTPATYDLSELGNFPVGRHVSLALELRNRESDGLAMSDDGIHKIRHQTVASSPGTGLLDCHLTDPGKEQHRLGKSHLLHEFVV